MKRLKATVQKRGSNVFDNSVVLVTGGTGTFGKQFCESLLASFNVKKLIIFSRDELKQSEMVMLPFIEGNLARVRFFLGDVRDLPRLEMAFDGVDYVVHAAALKQVPAAEYNPFEYIKTNILGAQNVIEAAFRTGVKKIVALSTDKAACPINLYGATKLAADKLFVAANNQVGSRDLAIAVVRYGNVMGSRGSVIPFFRECLNSNLGYLPVTDEEMTRFNITIKEGVDMVLTALEEMRGGEIFVPKIPSYGIVDLATAISGGSVPQKIVGIRPGEKLHEEMITSFDAPFTYDAGKFFIIFPHWLDLTKRDYSSSLSLQKVESGFSYNSLENPHYLTIPQLEDLIVNV